MVGRASLVVTCGCRSGVPPLVYHPVARRPFLAVGLGRRRGAATFLLPLQSGEERVPRLLRAPRLTSRCSRRPPRPWFSGLPCSLARRPLLSWVVRRREPFAPRRCHLAWGIPRARLEVPR